MLLLIGIVLIILWAFGTFVAHLGDILYFVLVVGIVLALYDFAKKKLD